MDACGVGGSPKLKENVPSGAWGGIIPVAAGTVGCIRSMKSSMFWSEELFRKS